MKNNNNNRKRKTLATKRNLPSEGAAGVVENNNEGGADPPLRKSPHFHGQHPNQNPHNFHILLDDVDSLYSNTNEIFFFFFEFQFKLSFRTIFFRK